MVKYLISRLFKGYNNVFFFLLSRKLEDGDIINVDISVSKNVHFYFFTIFNFYLKIILG